MEKALIDEKGIVILIGLAAFLWCVFMWLKFASVPKEVEEPP